MQKIWPILFLLVPLMLSSCGSRGDHNDFSANLAQNNDCDPAYVSDRNLLVGKVNRELPMLRYQIRSLEDKLKTIKSLRKDMAIFLKEWPNMSCEALMLDCDENSHYTCSLTAPWVERTIDNSKIIALGKVLTELLEEYDYN